MQQGLDAISLAHIKFLNFSLFLMFPYRHSRSELLISGLSLGFCRFSIQTIDNNIYQFTS
jgi:hypothetical protein